jgi:hypothetical protein
MLERYLKKYRMFVGKRACFSICLSLRDRKNQLLQSANFQSFLYIFYPCRLVEVMEAGAAKFRKELLLSGE